MTRRGWTLFITMCVVWGIPYLLIKVAVRDIAPVTLVFLRTAAGALLLLPLAVRRASLAPLLRHWRVLVVYTIVEVAVPWWLLADAEQRLTSSLTGLLIAAVPLIGALLLWVLGDADRLDGRRLIGLLAGLAGVGALLGLDVAGGDAGAVAEIGAVTVGYAVGPLIIARRLLGVPALGVVTASLVLTAAAYLPLAATHVPARVPPPAALASLGVLAVVCTAVAFLVFFELIATVGPARATVFIYVNPAVAVLLGAGLLHEPLTAGTGAGFVLILGGCFLATRPGRDRPPPAAVAPEPTADDVLQPVARP